jgi:hypothetical protein
VFGVSLAEITSAIDRLSAEERAKVALHLRRRFCEETPSRRKELSALRDEMEAGKQVSLAELKRRHKARSAKSA